MGTYTPLCKYWSYFPALLNNGIIASVTMLTLLSVTDIQVQGCTWTPDHLNRYWIQHITGNYNDSEVSTWLNFEGWRIDYLEELMINFHANLNGVYYLFLRTNTRAVLTTTWPLGIFGWLAPLARNFFSNLK